MGSPAARPNLDGSVPGAGGARIGGRSWGVGVASDAQGAGQRQGRGLRTPPSGSK